MKKKIIIPANKRQGRGKENLGAGVAAQTTNVQGGGGGPVKTHPETKKNKQQPNRDIRSSYNPIDDRWKRGGGEQKKCSTQSSTLLVCFTHPISLT